MEPRSRKWQSVRTILWLLPLIFLIHDGEELLTMPGWIATHQNELNRLASINESIAESIRSLPTTMLQTAIAIGLILFLFIVVTAGAFFSNGKGFWFYAYLCLLGILFLHVFTHLAQTIFFAGYTPGVIGAVIAIIPGSLYIYNRLFKSEFLTVKTAVISALIGLVLFVPGALLAQQIGRILAGS
jgi:hypothetical protein